MSNIGHEGESREQSYRRLVDKRKGCRLCQGLINPADEGFRQFDSDQIGPWSLWQGNIHSDLLIVGQDWGDTSYFLKWQGRDQPYGNPTNENLRRLLDHINIHVGRPRETQDQVIFSTNLVLCLKQGGLQAHVENQWFRNCADSFFRPLVNIIRPKAVLALGKKTATSILDAYRIKYPRSANYRVLLQSSPYCLDDSTVLFPLYHCGAGSVNRNRRMHEQRSDWTKMAERLKKLKKCVFTLTGPGIARHPDI